MTKLAEAQIAQYHEDGFVILRGALDPATVRRLRDEVDAVASTEQRPEAFYYHETSNDDPGVEILRRVERLSAASPIINELFRSDVVAGLVGQLFGEPAVLFKDKLNLKLPGGSGFRAHVDGHFLWKHPDGVDRRGWLEYGTEFINAVIGIDQSTRDNGCLEVAKLRETFERVGRTPDAIMDGVVGRGPDVTDEVAEAVTYQLLETEPGDIALFDWRCIHRSAPNHSTESRRILYSTYNRLSAGDLMARYYDDKRDSGEPVQLKSLRRDAGRATRSP